MLSIFMRIFQIYFLQRSTDYFSGWKLGAFGMSKSDFLGLLSIKRKELKVTIAEITEKTANEFFNPKN